MKKGVIISLIVLVLVVILMIGCTTVYDKCDINQDGTVDEKEQDLCEQNPAINICGDQRCDEKEEDLGTCPQDCSGTASGDGKTCGDGTCDEKELDTNSCPIDCDTEPDTNLPDNNLPAINECDLDGDGTVSEKEQDGCGSDQPITPGETCGDGICGEKELDTNSCPTDCDDLTTSKEFCGDGICQETTSGTYGGAPSRHGCSVDCWKFISPDPCGTIVPLSPVISSVSLDFNIPLLPINPSHGDFWRNTWAKDDKLYVTWGDGSGFNGDYAFHVIGVGAISGTLPNLQGENVYISEHLFPESEVNEKPGSLLAINDRLYLTGESSTEGFFIAYSDDQGQSWIKSPGSWETSWDLDAINGIHPNFINMGKNYEFGDEYVYATIHDDTDNTKIYLSRVLINDILDYDKYEYFVGNDAWDLSPNNAIQILPINSFEVTDTLVVTYHSGTNRYLLLTSQNVFDAPNPWGPWTCAGTWLTENHPEEWQGGYYPTIITKDFEGNNYQDNYIYFAIAGQHKTGVRIPYKFNVGKIVMELK
jgi:hypothetical protein